MTSRFEQRLTDHEIRKMLTEAAPGPWDIGRHGTYEVQTREGVLIADFGAIGRAKHDARLAAAAPELAAEVLWLRERSGLSLSERCSDRNCYVHDGEKCAAGDVDHALCPNWRAIAAPAGPPARRWRVTIDAGADDLDEALDLLEEGMSEMRGHVDAGIVGGWKCVSSSGLSLEVEHRPEAPVGEERAAALKVWRLATTTKLHDEAMRLSEEADRLRAAGVDGAAEVYSQAVDLERRAAEAETTEPSRGILHRSAASLALQAGEPEEAWRLACAGLGGVGVPNKVQRELIEVAMQSLEPTPAEDAVPRSAAVAAIKDAWESGYSAAIEDVDEERALGVVLSDEDRAVECHDPEQYLFEALQSGGEE